MNRSHLLALASAALLLITGPASAAPPNSSITGKDASAATVTMGAVSDGTLKSASHSLVDSTGAVLNPSSSDNQTAVQATAGSSSSKAVGVQGVAGGVAVGISAASLPLPTGAATSANQSTEITSLGTIATNSGTQATAANQTAVQGSKAPGTAAASSLLMGGLYNSAGVTLTNGQQSALQFDASGNLKINVVSGGAGGGAVTVASGADVVEGASTDTTCSTTHSVSGCLYALNQAAASGTATTGSAAPSTAIYVGVNSGGNLVGLALGQGTKSASLPMTLASDQGNLPTAAQAASTGGATPGTTAALSTTVTAIKASAGTLYKIRCYNPNASAAYVQIFNIASGSVTLGTSTAVDVVPIAATSAGGWAMSSVGEAYSAAISYAATTTATGSTALGTALTCAYAFN